MQVMKLELVYIEYNYLNWIQPNVVKVKEVSYAGCPRMIYTYNTI